jgi:uroporphyrinogen decarboxylase
LSEELFEKYVIGPTRKIVPTIKDKLPDFPIIVFPKSAGSFYKDYYKQTGV